MTATTPDDETLAAYAAADPNEATSPSYDGPIEALPAEGLTLAQLDTIDREIQRAVGAEVKRRSAELAALALAERGQRAVVDRPAPTPRRRLRDTITGEVHVTIGELVLALTGAVLSLLGAGVLGAVVGHAIR